MLLGRKTTTNKQTNPNIYTYMCVCVSIYIYIYIYTWRGATIGRVWASGAEDRAFDSWLTLNQLIYNINTCHYLASGRASGKCDWIGNRVRAPTACLLVEQHYKVALTAQSQDGTHCDMTLDVAHLWNPTDKPICISTWRALFQNAWRAIPENKLAILMPS